jgi:hypothetical protein
MITAREERSDLRINREMPEHRIVDPNLGFNPSPENNFSYKGNVTSDGGTYDIYIASSIFEGLDPQDQFSQ